MLRKLALVTVATMALVGCGRAPGPMAIVATGGQQAKAAARFVEVLQTEPTVWQAVNQAANQRLAEAPFQVPTGADGRLETATGLRVNWLALRATAQGREVVGEATIAGGPTTTFVPHEIRRAFRLVLDATGHATTLDPDFRGLATAPVERLKLAPADAVTARKLEADLKVFLNQSAQAKLRQQPMWGAIAGSGRNQNTAKLRAFQVTRGDHGAFGRIFAFEVELRVNGVLVLEGMPAGATADKAGRLIAVH